MFQPEAAQVGCRGQLGLNCEFSEDDADSDGVEVLRELVSLSQALMARGDKSGGEIIFYPESGVRKEGHFKKIGRSGAEWWGARKKRVGVTSFST